MMTPTLSVFLFSLLLPSSTLSETHGWIANFAGKDCSGPGLGNIPVFNHPDVCSPFSQTHDNVGVNWGTGNDGVVQIALYVDNNCKDGCFKNGTILTNTKGSFGTCLIGDAEWGSCGGKQWQSVRMLTWNGDPNQPVATPLS